MTRYVVRKGTEKGKGLYARNEGCLCAACLKWVEDRDDATKFASPMYPKQIAERDGGRVVRLRARSSRRTFRSMSEVDNAYFPNVIPAKRSKAKR